MIQMAFLERWSQWQCEMKAVLEAGNKEALASSKLENWDASVNDFELERLGMIRQDREGTGKETPTEPTTKRMSELRAKARTGTVPSERQGRFEIGYSNHFARKCRSSERWRLQNFG